MLILFLGRTKQLHFRLHRRKTFHHQIPSTIYNRLLQSQKIKSNKNVSQKMKQSIVYYCWQFIWIEVMPKY